ncbi:MAG: multicopper oxidase domain-containing protein [Pseudohongiella nitratireducens]|nr:multicopper oxidase domain-containing protein [Pseudohongiella nitratireducens]
MSHSSRRQFLQHTALGAGLLATSPLWASDAGDWSQTSFRPLPIPELISGEAQADSFHYYLRARHGETEFYPGQPTATMGLNGSYLGPTLQVRQHEQVHIHVQNDLSEATTLHWHGMDVPAEEDGGPYQIIQPGNAWTARYTVKNPAATCWYHSHMMHQTGRQVYHGLAGLLIVDDEHHRSLPLPQDYGVDDIPLILQDRLFDDQGQLSYPDRMDDHMVGMRGDVMVVNGVISPTFIATTGRVRLRLLNAANARAFTLAFSDGRHFDLIATDLSLIEKPLTLETLVLSPGERAEIVVDTLSTQPFTLVNLPVPSTYQAHFGLLSDLMRELDTQAFDVLTIIPPAAAVPAAPALPAQLNDIDWLPEQDASYHRLIAMQMGEGQGNGGKRGGGPGARRERGGWGGGKHRINGRMMDMNFIEASIVAGTTEIWEITNDSPMMHPFHIHKVHFQILDRNGEPPGEDERGYKDTVRVPPFGRVRVIARFSGESNPHIPFMFHCHILEHEDNGMMGQFVIV